jgi:hypothetical protein
MLVAVPIDPKALEKLREQLPPGPKQPDPPTLKGPARAVVRLERKQRRGK